MVTLFKPLNVSVSPMYVQALSTSKRSKEEVYIPNEYLAERNKQQIRDRVARHRKEKRKLSNVLKKDMSNEEEATKIKQQKLRDRVARHREETLKQSKANSGDDMLNEEEANKIKQQKLRDRVARHREETLKQSKANSGDILNKKDEIKIKEQQLRERVHKHWMMKKKQSNISQQYTTSQDNNNHEGNQVPTSTMARHYHQINGQNSRNSENSFLKDEINESEVKRLLKEMSEKEENEYIENNPDKRSAVVCVVCDCIVLDGDEMDHVDKNDLLQSCDKLSVTAYREHFGYESLNEEELIRQYQVLDEDLHGYLLSPRSKLSKDGYQCCSSCKLSLSTKTEACPKYSIANGFAIGCIPNVIKFKNNEGQIQGRQIDHENDLDDLVCAAISPVRPFGYVHAYTGGCQKQIKGQFSLFSIDQSHVGGVLNKFRTDRGSKNIFVVLCGRMTPNQKSLLKRKARLKTDLFLDLLTWFVKSSQDIKDIRTLFLQKNALIQ